MIIFAAAVIDAPGADFRLSSSFSLIAIACFTPYAFFRYFFSDAAAFFFVTEDAFAFTLVSPLIIYDVDALADAIFAIRHYAAAA